MLRPAYANWIPSRGQPLRRFVVLAGLMIATTVWSGASEQNLCSAAERRPNILLIMADDLRPDLASYGAPAKTPNLDRLARRSLQFNRAYCQQALCNPSRSSLLTGRRPDTLGIWSNSVHFRERNSEIVTLPEHFLRAGYTTRCVGKIFHNWHTQARGDRRSWSAPEFLHYANHGDDLARVTGQLPPNVASPSPRNYGQVPLYECRDVPDNAYYDGQVADEALRVLSAVREEPFFLAVGFWKPHAPFNAPRRYWDLYERSALPPLDDRRPIVAGDWAYHNSSEIRGGPAQNITFTAEQVAEMRHGYLANISYLDAQVGRLLQALDEHQLTERTIVVFVSDHGFHLGEHQLWGKTSNFELDARVPLLISVPGAAMAGQQTTSLVELVDLFPTLVDAGGLPTVAGLDGHSLLPLLRDRTAVVKPAAYTQHPRPAYYDREPTAQPRAMGYSVRTPTVRYTEWREFTTGNVLAAELYDALDDSAETRNLIDDPAWTDARRTAEKLLPPRIARQ